MSCGIVRCLSQPIGRLIARSLKLPLWQAVRLKGGIAVEDKQRIYDQLQRESDAYAKKSTQLSNLLLEAEHFLQELSGKIAVEVNIGHGNLGFFKHGGVWRLYYDIQPVTEADVKVKANAARTLPKLFEQLVTELR